MCEQSSVQHMLHSYMAAVSDSMAIPQRLALTLILYMFITISLKYHLYFIKSLQVNGLQRRITQSGSSTTSKKNLIKSCLAVQHFVTEMQLFPWVLHTLLVCIVCLPSGQAGYIIAKNYNPCSHTFLELEVISRICTKIFL